MESKHIGIVGTGNYRLDKIKSIIMSELFIKLDEVVDPFTFLSADIQKETITIMKSSSCGMTDYITNPIYYFDPEKIKNNFKKRAYVDKSVKDLIRKQDGCTR